MLIAIIVVYVYIKHDNTLYILRMNDSCPDKEEYRMFNPDGLFNALSIFSLMGGHLGIILLVRFIDFHYPNKQEEIYEWNINSCKYIFYRILCVLFCVIPFILYFVIPGNSDLIVIFVFKVALPYSVSSFLVFGLSLWFIVYKKFANNKIYIVEVSYNNSDSELKKIDL